VVAPLVVIDFDLEGFVIVAVILSFDNSMIGFRPLEFVDLL
jgi:hypothetical protein